MLYDFHTRTNVPYLNENLNILWKTLVVGAIVGIVFGVCLTSFKNLDVVQPAIVDAEVQSVTVSKSGDGAILSTQYASTHIHSALSGGDGVYSKAMTLAALEKINLHSDLISQNMRQIALLTDEVNKHSALIDKVL